MLMADAGFLPATTTKRPDPCTDWSLSTTLSLWSQWHLLCSREGTQAQAGRQCMHSRLPQMTKMGHDKSGRAGSPQPITIISLRKCPSWGRWKPDAHLHGDCSGRERQAPAQDHCHGP